MPRNLCIGLCAAAVLLAGASPADAKPRSAPCFPRGAKSLDGSGKVRVYARAGKVVACSLRNGRKTVLGLSGASYTVRATRVAGDYVGYLLAQPPGPSSLPSSSQELAFMRVSTGRRLPVGDLGCRQPGRTVRLFPSFDVAANGAAVWSCIASREVQIRRFVPKQGSALVAGATPGSEERIDAASVTLDRSGSRVYWSAASREASTYSARMAYLF